LHLVLTIVFYAFAILAVVGALAAALSATASHRLLGLIGVAVGTAGVLISFSVRIVALVALVCRGRARARPMVMTLSFGHALVAGAALMSGGALADVWRRGEGGALAARPALICVLGLAASILSAAWVRGRPAR